MDKTQWNERIKLIEAALLKELGAETALVPRLAESMEYSLMAGGKRLRPILVMAAADAVGARGTSYCVIERSVLHAVLIRPPFLFLIPMLPNSEQ